MPWAGLAIGVIALAVAHQFGSDGSFDHCGSISPAPLIVVSLLAIAATLAGAFVSWNVYRQDAEPQARKVISAISMGSAALFTVAMIFPIIAALVIPPCFQ
jgi:hypothetical protein